MSDLETLKAQHPDFLTRWDRSTVDGFMETTIIGGYVRHEDAAALLALVQQHEATIAEQGVTISVLDGDLQNAKCDLAAAQSTIQQQARELEEVDREVCWCQRSFELHGLTVGAVVAYSIYRKCIARHSARAQQDKSETKKEE